MKLRPYQKTDIQAKHVLTDEEYLEEQRLLREEETKLEF